MIINYATSESILTIYGCIAQSESENISANVRWGKEQSAKEGKVIYQYKYLLGYRRGEDGKPEIIPEEAEVVRLIFKLYLEGETEKGIADHLASMDVLTPRNKNHKWHHSTVKSILQNEKYKGDAIINKTYITDCISKKARKNNGERPMFYVENCHDPIVEREIFDRVQEEISRRASLRRVRYVGTKTEKGKYSGKYALTERLYCGECGSPYRRVVWTIKGEKVPVWRCVSRLDFGKKYCKKSPSIEEKTLHRAIMRAVSESALQNAEVLETLKRHISLVLLADEDEVDISIDYELQIEALNREYKEILGNISFGNSDNSIEERMLEEIIVRRNRLQKELEEYRQKMKEKQKKEMRVTEICEILDVLKNHPLKYNDKLVRQCIESVKVLDKENILIKFKGGMEVKESLI